MDSASTRASKSLSRRLYGLIFLSLGLGVGLSLLTYHPEDQSLTTLATGSSVHNAMGLVGAYLSDALLQLFGGGAYGGAAVLVLIGWRWLWARPNPFGRWQEQAGFVLILLSGSILMDLDFTHLPSLTADEVWVGRAGGMIGRWGGLLLIGYFASIGTHLILLSAFAAGLLLTVPFPAWVRFGRLLRNVLEISIVQSKQGVVFLSRLYEEWRARSAEPEVRTVRPPDDTPATPDPPHLSEPRIIQNPLRPKPVKDAARKPAEPGSPFELPPMSLLKDPPVHRGGTSPRSRSKEDLLQYCSLLEEKLADYGIEGRVSEVHPGPVVTLYEFEPSPGTKLSRIVNLSDDLALAMRAMSVRIVAPLPGRSSVGIEIPNPVREDVYLKEVLTRTGSESSEPALPLALGKDIFGQTVVADLAVMPHLLVAGATGSGKSVALNTMILSLLFSSAPDRLRLILIDPKLLELSIYDGIPHLLSPVIVRAKDATGLLQYLIQEMQQRYRLMAEAGVRNIEGYNERVRGGLAAETSAPASGEEEASHGLAGASAGRGGRPPQMTEDGNGAARASALPYLVVVIDELADLMLVAAREVEDGIARLAQMARAAGIHLVLATQRPSVDVLTGIIKANFPARISFQVSSKVDSRTILDANGAEQLLGRGDMLFLSPGTGKLQRIHGAYVSEEEIRRVVDFVKAQAQPDYVQIQAGSSGEGAAPGSFERDELYEQAVELVVTSGQASASLVQRRLRVGYPRAARMIEMMEEDRIVSATVGGKPREVLVRDLVQLRRHARAGAAGEPQPDA
jgi:S-DNA-T family DNA segregation ATPase FtsK/SpoIIIE